jgi:proteic killer suppression protein
MIRSFRDRLTKRVFERIYVKTFSPDFQRVALRKLEILNAALTLDDLRIPPGNRLEKLTGDREGQYSIRINEQFRVCYEWKDGDAYEVEIVDYHS